MAGQLVNMEVSAGGYKGTAFVTKQLQKHIHGYDDLRKLFDDLASAFWQFEEKGFARQNIGGRWGDLEDSTIEQKQRTWPRWAATPLHRTLALKESLTQPHGNWQVYRVKKTEMEIGTSLDYAHFHQLGTHKMPRRMTIPTALEFNKDTKTGDIMKQFQFGICREVYARR